MGKAYGEIIFWIRYISIRVQSCFVTYGNLDNPADVCLEREGYGDVILDTKNTTPSVQGKKISMTYKTKRGKVDFQKSICLLMVKWGDIKSPHLSAYMIALLIKIIQFFFQTGNAI